MISLRTSLIFLFYWNAVLAEENGVTQIPSVAWHLQGESAEMKCSHNKDAGYYQMYWFRQHQGQSMELIVYITTSNQPDFGSVDRNKFSAIKKIAANGSLTVKDLVTEDSAVYFCAIGQDNLPAHFGQGTKLTVLDNSIKITEPKRVSLLDVSENEVCTKTNVTLVCVAEGFYPDHVSVSWSVDGEERETDVSTDEAAIQDVETNFYSISSRLNINYKDEWTKGKEFTCTVNFFNGTVYTEHSDSYRSPKIDLGENLVEKYIQSANVTMLAYGMFIGKSIAYGLFILYVIKRQGFISK